MKRTILLLVVGSLTSLVAFSQTSPIKITGKVLNEKNEPLSGATVRTKDGKTGTYADANGGFQLQVTSLPVTLLISYINYEENAIAIEKADGNTISLNPSYGMINAVVLESKGIPTKILDAAFTAKQIGPRTIRNLPGPIYDALNFYNVDLTSSSLTFKTPVTRGFNGSGSTRVNQIVDGMDNQAPGLNFFVGNFTGLTELDIESVEILPGASSALYGPGGMNGTILMNSKNPFKYQGLSITAKPGIMHLGKTNRSGSSMYHDYSLRWAKAFNNKFAFKIGAQYISANDWLASDTTNYLRTGTSGRLISGTRATDPNYDGVNVYGDETSVNIYDVARFMEIQNFLPPGASMFVPDMNVSRTGYYEKEIIDPETKNIKLSGALHYKISDKIEAQFMGYWATGNTVYTDDNRYALKGIKIGQYKFELKHKNWFLRSYTTQENAGEAYSATVATQYFNEAWKKSQLWYPEYVGAYVTGASQIFTDVLTRGGSIADAQAAVINASSQLHTASRAYADRDRPAAGSDKFNQLFEQVRKTPIRDGGGLFKERSQLWMTEGQYTLGDAVKSAELIMGGNYKKYVLNSSGTLFIDTLGAININEVGAYAQVTKKLFDQKLSLITSGRFDKNENFKAQFTPRFAALIKVAKDNNVRMSYQTAYRFPGNLSQWIRLDVGGDYLLLGGLPWVMDYMQAAKYPVHLITGEGPTFDPNPYVYKAFKPETMSSFEFGYKGLINNKLLIDAYAYFGKYKDFIGRIGLFQPATNEAYSIVVNSANKVKTHGFGLGMDYKVKKNCSVFFNLYSDVITDVPSGFKAYFNAPKYKLTAGISHDGIGKSERIGFSAMMRWQDAFQYEGELANGPINAFSTIDAQMSYKFPKLKSSIRIGGTNILNHYYKNAYGNPSIGGLYYAGFIYNIL